MAEALVCLRDEGIDNEDDNDVGRVGWACRFRNNNGCIGRG